MRILRGVAEEEEVGCEKAIVRLGGMGWNE